MALTLGSATTYIDTYLLVGFLSGLGMFGLLSIFFFRPYVQIKSTLPKHAVAGQDIPFTVSIHNIGNKPAYELVLHPVDAKLGFPIEPQEHLLSLLRPGSCYECHFIAHFKKRGVFYFSGFWADTAMPFGWIRMGRYHQPCETTVVVYPKFTPLENLHVPTGRRYQPGGVAFASDLGDSAEYIGNREYQQGDSLRNVDWHSWARLGIPIVREYQEEYFCRIALVMNTNIGMKATPDRLQDFEAMLSLAAAMVDFLSRQEYLLDIFAAGPQVYVLESGRSLAHFENVLEVLACLEPCHADYFNLVEAILHQNVETLTSIIVLLHRMDANAVQFLQQWQPLGIGIKVVICQSQPYDSGTVEALEKLGPGIHAHILTAAEITNGVLFV